LQDSNLDPLSASPHQDVADPDELYSLVELVVKGHDAAVLRSYEKFVRTTCSHLALKVAVETPPMHFLRRTLLKSVHIFKKHRVQYEIRTYYKSFKLRNVTGSTAATVLEYWQRHLPEGVAMTVTRHQLLPLPEGLVDVSEKSEQTEDTDPPNGPQ